MSASSPSPRALPPTARRTVEAVTPDYFAAMGIPVERGRPFDARYNAGPAVAIVNTELARQLWPDADPLGATLRLGAGDVPYATVKQGAFDARFTRAAAWQLLTLADYDEASGAGKLRMSGGEWPLRRAS
jgi:hypothetical protein